MRLHKGLFWGESVLDKKHQIIWRLKHKRLQRNVHVLTLASNGIDLIDIYPSYVFMQPYFQKEDFYVIGLAGSRQEALTLSRFIVEQMYMKNGNCNIREFLHIES